MAKLKIGKGIEFKADLGSAKIDAEPVMPELKEVNIQEAMKSFNFDDMVKQALESLLPKKEEVQELKVQVPEVNLDEVHNKLNKMNSQLTTLSLEVGEAKAEMRLLKKDNEELCVKLDEYKNSLVIPEVKHITTVRDVSEEALSTFYAKLKEVEASSNFKINTLQKENKKQVRMNMLLSISLILTIFFHLI